MSRKHQHIIRLEAENFKRLRAVEITPEGKVTKITGPNEAGKSTVLDAIEYALGGGHTFKGVRRPINKDAEQAVLEGDAKARIVVETEDYVVTRHWTDNETSYLAVKSREGAKFSNAQAVLDRMVSRISFDPLAFSRMKPAEQSDQLLGLLGLQEAMMRLAQERRRDFEERTAVNREVKRLKGELDSCPTPPEGFDPDAPTPDYAAEVAEAQGVNVERRSRTERNVELQRSIEQMEAQLARARALVAENDAWLEANPARDEDFIVKARQAMEEASRTRDVWRRRNAAELAYERVAQKSKELDAAIEAHDAKKVQLLAEADTGAIVPGLGFEDVDGETVVTVDGIPFNQLSQGQKIKIGFNVLRALNPELRVICIRDGSLLDERNMALVAQLCEEHDFQAFIEVATTDETVGVFIEDGSRK